MGMRATPSPSARKSTILVPNLHCPTCSSFVAELLDGLSPKPFSVETSIISQTITVEHDAVLDVFTISKALADSGYEVDSIIQDEIEIPRRQLGISSGSADDGFPLPWVSSAVLRWSRAQPMADTDTQRERHAEHCQACRDKLPHGFSVVTDSPKQRPISRVILSLSGMSCSSCVAKITGVLEEREWITRANVNLLTQTASVDMFGDHDAQELVEIIKGTGYAATVELVEQVEQAGQPNPPGRTGPDASLVQWQATLSIGGMTCSSCVGTITEALRAKPWIRTVDVNLVTHSATVVFENRANLDDIIDTIQDLGYEASINDVLDLAKTKKHDARRTLSVKVEGLYCQHCPGRVLEALKTFGDRVTIEKAPTTNDPVVTVTYLPEAPSFTVRSILTAIAGADKVFEPSIFHPPTLEERSRQMLARSRRRLLYRTLLTVVTAIPSLIIGIVYMTLVSDHDPGRMYLMEELAGVSRAEWANFIMATPVYFFAADIFHRRTIKELYNLWKPGSTVPLARRFYRFGSMDMLICFATTIAYVASIVELIIAGTLPEGKHMSGSVSYFDSVVFLTMFLLIGRMIEAFSKAKTGEAVSKLGNLRPKEALLVVSGEEGTSPAATVPTPVAMLDTGDIIRVVHGGSPPWDGVVTEGETEFAESSLTGESRPIKKRRGDPIYAGTVNKGGPISVRVTGAAGESLLDQIIKVVREGQARRAPMERVADTITGYFVPIVTLLAILTWLIWLGLGVSGRLPESYLDISVGGWPFWSLQFAIAVFVIACPCGIGLAAPTALFVGGGLAAKHGILAKGGGEAFQEASKLDVVVFDKTGTLTEGGEPKLTDQRFFEVEDGMIWNRQLLLSCLGELESNSSHPIAKAIVAFCKSTGSNKTGVKAKKIEEVPGKGMKGSFGLPSSGDVEVIVGNETLMTDHGVHLDSGVLDTLNKWKHEAKSVVLAAVRTEEASETTDSWRLAAIFGTSDPLRPESKRVIEALRKQRIDVWMLSGDNQATANAVGALAGIPPDRIIAGVLPEQKAEKIQYLQKSQVKVERQFLGIGRSTTTRRATVAMVGDGVNDSPALTVADVGIAIGSGSDVAISAAEFVLVSSSLATLVTLTQLSRAVFRRVRFNFAWAMVYNMVALPVAAGVFYAIRTGSGAHVRLDPVWAALAMACSSLSVICSSLLLQTRLPLVGYRGSDIEV